jgi:hypothetical protein
LQALNDQINVEYTASYAYHSLFAYFDRDTVALKGFAKFFAAQSEEVPKNTFHDVDADSQSHKPVNCVRQVDVVKKIVRHFATALSVLPVSCTCIVAPSDRCMSFCIHFALTIRNLLNNISDDKINTRHSHFTRQPHACECLPCSCIPKKISLMDLLQHVQRARRSLFFFYVLFAEPHFLFWCSVFVISQRA